MQPDDRYTLPPILNKMDFGEIISGVAVPPPPRGRRAFCKRFCEEQKDNHSPHRDTINTWCRKLPHHLSMCDEVPHPASSKMKLAGHKILTPITKAMDRRRIISGVMRPRKKYCDTVRVPQPPPSGTSKIHPRISKRKDYGNTGLNQNGVAVPHPPSGRSLFCRQFVKKQRDNVSPWRDTFSTWSKRRVQLPDIWSRNVCDTDLDPTNGSFEIADVEAPQQSSEQFAFCKQYKEEEKDKPSVRQETYSSWCKHLPKVRRKDGVTDPSDVQWGKDHDEVGKLWGILMEDVRRKQGSKKSPESRHYRDGNSLPEQENKKTEKFTRHLAEGCWDLCCLQRLISDLQREEPSDSVVTSRKQSNSLVSSWKRRDSLWRSRKQKASLVRSWKRSDLLVRTRKNYKKLEDVDERSTATTDSWNTTDNNKLLGKLQHQRMHLHFVLKSFIDERKTAQEMDKLNVHVDLHAELEYEKIEKTYEFYRMYKDLCFNLMLPEWQEKFQMDPEDPFYFENPQHLIDWMNCMEMSDLVDG